MLYKIPEVKATNGIIRVQGNARSIGVLTNLTTANY
jgi:hypothetical protein